MLCAISVGFCGGHRGEECAGAHAAQGGDGAAGRLRREEPEQERLLQRIRRQQSRRGADQAALQERCHHPEVRPEEAGHHNTYTLTNNPSP